MDLSDAFLIFWNGLNQVGVIRINVNRSRIFLIPIYNQVGVIPIYICFEPNFFNFEIIFELIIFETFFASKVLH